MKQTRGFIFKSEAHTAGVAMLPDDPAVTARRMQVELLSHNVAETSRVEVCAGANHTMTGEATQFPGNVGQDVHWIDTE